MRINCKDLAQRYQALIFLWLAMKKKILVVDDERSIRDLLSIYLKREGFEVHCAEDGQAALECCQELEFDIVITDIKMPKLDGI